MYYHTEFDSMYYIFGAFGLFFLLAGAVLVVLWIALPFSVFGMKDLVRRSIEEQKKTNRLLEALLERARYKEIAETSEEKESDAPGEPPPPGPER